VRGDALDEVANANMTVEEDGRSLPKRRRSDKIYDASHVTVGMGF
jgi:hypothetical protein